MPKPQTKESHAALDPLYHFFGMPLLLLSAMAAIGLMVMTTTGTTTIRELAGSLWRVALSLGALAVAIRMRLYALRVQDRVIALEVERRYERLGGRAVALTERLKPGQLVALRFASDAELVALADSAAAEGLNSRAIKQRITTWRPDYRRI